MNLSVIIVTLNRADCVRTCLERLQSQTPVPDQIIVVDASLDDLTRDVVAKFEGVLYLRNENGYGRMTASRNIGLKVATGDIIAFLDDDAFAHPGWAQNLMATYTDRTIGAVGGRALNNQPDEATLGVDKIGRLTANGVLHGYFAADPGEIIEVDHVMGCNMSFRREVVARLGGFREDYPGISGVREDSDMCLRVKSLKYRILFNPLACVDHIGAPQAKGKRFDMRYLYFSERNHLVLLVRNFGLNGAIVWRYILHSIVWNGFEFGKKTAAATLRLFIASFGALLGISNGILLTSKKGHNPSRTDEEGRLISAALRQKTNQEIENHS